MRKNLALWFAIALALMAFFSFFTTQNDNFSSSNEKPFTEFLGLVDAGQIKKVTIENNILTYDVASQGTYKTVAPYYPQLIDRLEKKGIVIDVKIEEKMSPLLSALISWMPMLLLIGVWIFFMRQMNGGAGKAMGFGKSRAKMLNEKVGHVTFDDIAGIDEAKSDLEEVVDFLKSPEKFQRLGGKIPKGMLLIGPPGTGKTLLARAIAGEANVPFFTISGSDFVEMFVGVGASRVRDMFEQGKKNAPCIIFIDEIDAVGRHRGMGLGGGNDEREQTLNQLLVEMDGFESNEGVILISATNRPDVLDPALLRPGRFDRQIVVPNPDIKGREKILSIHAKKIPLHDNVDLSVIARGTPGFSGADLANLVNESALLAARKNRRQVGMSDFEQAKDKVMMGAERRSMMMTEDDKKLTAYHEGGHALVALHTPASDPIHKVTIIPRGRALGMVMQLPERDMVSQSYEQLNSYLAVAMGGRVAEELIFGLDKITTGASSDIKVATNYARKMVTEWGMSEKVGPILCTDSKDDAMMPQRSGAKGSVSEQTAQTIDEEVKKIIDRAYATASDILNKHIDKLHILAKALLEYETLSGSDIPKILEGQSLKPDDADEKAQKKAEELMVNVPNIDANDI